jgi:hypothetical protein
MLIVVAFLVKWFATLAGCKAKAAADREGRRVATTDRVGALVDR